jgi:hypothetical protein
VRSEAPLLRRLGTRFYLSSGSTADRRTAALAIAFAHALDALRLPHALYLRPGAHNGRFWLAQFPEALLYALPAPRSTIRVQPADTTKEHGWLAFPATSNAW